MTTTPQPHVLLLAGDDEVRGVDAVTVERIDPDMLMAALRPDVERLDVRAIRAVRQAARHSRGLPGRFVKALWPRPGHEPKWRAAFRPVARRGAGLGVRVAGRRQRRPRGAGGRRWRLDVACPRGTGHPSPACRRGASPIGSRPPRAWHSTPSTGYRWPGASGELVRRCRWRDIAGRRPSSPGPGAGRANGARRGAGLCRACRLRSPVDRHRHARGRRLGEPGAARRSGACPGRGAGWCESRGRLRAIGSCVHLAGALSLLARSLCRRPDGARRATGRRVRDARVAPHEAGGADRCGADGLAVGDVDDRGCEAALPGMRRSGHRAAIAKYSRVRPPGGRRSGRRRPRRCRNRRPRRGRRTIRCAA